MGKEFLSVIMGGLAQTKPIKKCILLYARGVRKVGGVIFVEGILSKSKKDSNGNCLVAELTDILSRIRSFSTILKNPNSIGKS
ncbi:MAG: hypothetical protein KKE23_04515 [Nanoarchaeota archaeon]|nr:hypothetical protein [Nanoarchaeota archaeon]